jgi:hypothetical protein
MILSTNEVSITVPYSYSVFSYLVSGLLLYVDQQVL